MARSLLLSLVQQFATRGNFELVVCQLSDMHTIGAAPLGGPGPGLWGQLMPAQHTAGDPN